MNFKKFLLSACITFLNSQGVQAIGTTIQTTFSSRITGGVGCQYGDQVGTVDGFGATIYSYPNQGSAGWTTTTGGEVHSEHKLFMNDYSKYGLETSTTGVLNPTFTCEKDENHPDSTTKAFGVEVAVQHFLLELDGYFYANVSGLYTFRLLAVDDLAAIWFGSGLSCCNSDVPEDSESPSFWASWDRTSNENGAAVANLYLTAGIYYPIKVRFANTNRAGALAFEVVDPSGNTINDFKGSVYRFVNIENRCTTVSATFPFSTLTVSDQEDSTFAVPTTTTDSAGDTVSTTVVIVEVSTTTKQTNTPTSTSFNNMLATVSTSETTSSEVLSTITEDPDIPETITTTKLTTFTNSDGSVETTRIVVIEVPGTTTTPANLTSTGVPQNTSSISTSEFVNNTQTSTEVPQNTSSISTSEFVNNTQTSTEVPQNTSSILTSEFVNNTQTSLFVNTTSYWSVPLTTSTSNTSDSTSSYSPFTITSSSEVLSTITEDPDIPETITTTKLTTFTNSDGSVETTRIVVIEVPGTTTTPANLTSTGVPQNTSSISTSEFVNNTQTSTEVPQNTSSILTSEFVNNTQTSTEVPQNTSSILTSEFVNNTQTSLFVNTTSYWSVPLTTSTSNTSDSTSSYSPFTITSSSEVLSTITEDPDIPETITTTKLTTFTNSDGSVETTRIVVIEVPGTTTTPANLTSTGVPQNTSSISTSEFVNNTQTSTEVPQNTSSILTSEFVNNTQTSILMSTSSSWESSISSSSIMFWNSSIAITSSTTVLVSSTSSEVLSTITEDPDIPETITTTKLTTFTNWDGSVETTRIVVVEVPGTTTVSESTSEEESSTSATTSLTNGITSTQNTSFTSSQTTESTSDASSTKSDNIVSVSATPAISSESVLVSTTSNLGSSVATSSISKSSPVSTSSLTGSSTSSSSEVLSTITEDPDIPEVMTTTKLTTFTNSDGSVKTTRIVVVEVPGSTTSSTSSIETKSFISSVVTGNNTATAWRSLSTSQLESFSNTSAATSFEQSNKGPSFTETSSSIQSSSNTASALKTLVTNTINNVSSLSSETGKAEFSNTIDVSNTEATFGGASATTKSPYSSAKITSSPTQHHSTYPSTTITISQQSAESYAGNTPQISIYRGGAAESSNLNKFYFAFALIALLPFA
ncbi:hypothetical protein HII13_005062 [Brettanomyces bruxellensis]|nr:hypothetical protein HII13_005062 [Brettanomyces bruxellensis]